MIVALLLCSTLAFFVNLKAIAKACIEMPMVLSVALMLLVFWHCMSVAWAVQSELVFESLLGLLIRCQLFICFFSLLRVDFAFYKRILGLSICATLLVNFSDAAIEIFSKAREISDGKRLQVSGLQGHRNLFSSFCLLSFALLYYIASEDEDKRFRRCMRWFSFVSLFFALIAGSVFSFLLALVCIGVLLAHSNEQFISARTGVIMVFVLSSILLTGFSNRLDPQKFLLSRSYQERAFVWKRTVDLIEEKPLLGLGAFNWRIAWNKGNGSLDLGSTFLYVNFKTPHNDFLFYAADFGIFFLVFCSIVLFWLIFRLLNKEGLRSKFLLLFVVIYLSLSLVYSPRNSLDAGALLSFWMAIAAFQVWERCRKTPHFLRCLLLCLMIGISGWGIAYSFKQSKCAEIAVGLSSHLKKGRFHESFLMASQAIDCGCSLTNSHTPFEYYRCSASYMCKEYDSAYEYCTKAIAQHPSHYKSIVRLAEIQHKRDKIELGDSLLQAAIWQRPYDELASAKWIRIQLRRKECSSADSLISQHIIRKKTKAKLYRDLNRSCGKSEQLIK